MFYYSHYSYLFADSATRLLHFGSRQVTSDMYHYLIL